MAIDVPLVKAFISHSRHDRALAIRLCDCLEAAGIRPWRYDVDLPLGHGIPSKVYAEMRGTDYCIVLLTPASAESAWVARELELATRFRQSASLSRPQILGVTANLPAPPCIALRNFETHEECGTIDFSQVNCVQLDGLTDHELTREFERLAPRLTWLSDQRHEPELEQRVVECYNDLFPEEERDPWEDIVSWMNEALVANAPWERWREYCAALHLDDAVLGFAYLSFHVHSQWCGGCYLGVREAWRDKNRAMRLLREVADRVGREWPKAKGILFEVEMVDIPLLEAATRCKRLADFPSPDLLRFNILALVRLLIYQSHGCRAFVTRANMPLNVVQPALTEPLDESREQPMILMFLRVHDAPLPIFQPEDVLQYWYLEFYGQSHDDSTAAYIRDYQAYVTTVRDRVLRNAATQGFELGVVAVPCKVRRLVTRAVAEGFMPSVKL